MHLTSCKGTFCRYNQTLNTSDAAIFASHPTNIDIFFLSTFNFVNKLFVLVSLSLSLSLGQPKVNKVKNFLPILKLMKRPQTKFYAHTMSDFKVIKTKKVKIYY